jgi:hypothetical protein
LKLGRISPSARASDSKELLPQTQASIVRAIGDHVAIGAQDSITE